MKLKCLVWQLATYRMWSQLPFQLLAPCSLSYALGSDCISQLLIALHFAHLVPSPWKVFPTPILSLYPPFCLQNSNSFPHEESKLHPSTGGLCCPNSIGPGIIDNSALVCFSTDPKEPRGRAWLYTVVSPSVQPRALDAGGRWLWSDWCVHLPLFKIQALLIWNMSCIHIKKVQKSEESLCSLAT